MTSSQRELPRGVAIASLRDLYYVVFRHLPAAAVCLFLGTALTTVFLRLKGSEYRSEAKLLVRLDHEAAPMASGGDAALRAQLMSELEILRSHELSSRVSTALSKAVPASITGDEGVIELSPSELSEDLVLQVEDESSVIGLAFDRANPRDAQRILETLVDLFLSMHIEVYEDQGAYEFFLQQTQVLKGQIAETESELYQLKVALHVSTFEEDRRTVLESITELDRKQHDVLGRVASLQARTGRLAAALEAMPSDLVMSEATGQPNPPAEWLRERLYEMRMSETDLVNRFPEDSRSVVDMRTQIDAAEQLLAAAGENPSQVTRGPNANHQRLSLDLVIDEASLFAEEAQIALLDQRISAARARLSTLNENEAKLNELEQRVQYQRESQQRYLLSLEQARVERALNTERISNLAILQRATLPTEPFGPGNLPLFLFGVFLSAALAFGMTLVFEFFSDSVDTPDALESRVGLRTFVSLPLARRWQLGDVPADASRSFRDFREQLVLAGPRAEGQPRFVAVTSSQRGAGVTTVATGLAESLAQYGEGPVALVDANFDDPRITQALSDRNAFGIADALAGNGDLPRGYPVYPIAGAHNLYIIPSGQQAPLVANRLDPEEIMERLRGWTRAFDYVVLDFPPITSSNAAAALAAACDDRIIVVESGRTRWQAIRRTADIVSRPGRGLVGTVLNKRRFPIPGWLYRTL